MTDELALQYGCNTDLHASRCICPALKNVAMAPLQPLGAFRVDCKYEEAEADAHLQEAESLLEAIIAACHWQCK